MVTWPFLLAYMWQLPPWVVLLLLSTAVLVCSCGVMTLAASRGNGRLRIAGAASLFLGLTWLYAVVTPPFQAPDEPTHFLGLLHSIGRSADTAEVKEWANRGHFLDLQFKPDEKFRAEWRTYYTRENLDAFFLPVDMETRAPLTAWLWRGLRPILGECGIQWCLLLMRLINGLLVAGAYLLALVVVGRCTRGSAGDGSPCPPSPSALGSAVLLYVPAVPFFAMHVSNYPLLISAGTIAGFIALSLLFSGQRPPWLGGLLGGAIFILMFSGRGGYPFSAAVLLLVILGEVLPRSRDDGSPERASAALFWASCALGWVVSWFLLGRLDLALVPLSIPMVGNRLASNAWLLIAVPIACYAAEYLVSSVRHLRLSSRNVRLITVPGLLLFSCGILGPMWGTSHYLETIEGAPLNEPTPLTYIRHVIVAFGGSQGFGDPDYLLVRYFWSGFGWLDTLFPGRVVMALGLPIFLGNLLLWLQACRAASLPLASRLWAWFLTCTVYLSVLAYGARSIPVNLHGRYLVLFYLLFLPPGFAGFFSWSTQNPWKNRLRRFRSAEVTLSRLTSPGAAWYLMIALCTSAHFYAVWFMVNRYF